MYILTKEHKRWKEFITRLEGKDGCNFRKVEGKTKWDCDSSEERPLARKILSSMGGIDIEETMKYFKAKGGLCDCEIVFNV